MPHILAKALSVLGVGLCVATACDDSEPRDAGHVTLQCEELDQSACSQKAACAWNNGVCIALDATVSDAPACTLPACPSPQCGQLWVDGGWACIARPDCFGLPQAECIAKLGCRAIVGRLPTDPGGVALQYVGCGDGLDSPGTMITCTSSGPDADCWILPDTGVPSGWKGWSCADPKTREECLAQGPHAGE